MKTHETNVKKLARCLDIVALFYTSGLKFFKITDLLNKYHICSRTLQRDIAHLAEAGFVLERYKQDDAWYLRRMR